jgi:hypothetical protein
VAGKGWATEAVYVDTERRYSHVTVDAQADSA